VRLFEVSVVTGFPAYEATQAAVRSLEKLSERTGMAVDELSEALDALADGQELDPVKAELLMGAIKQATPQPEPDPVNLLGAEAEAHGPSRQKGLVMAQGDYSAAVYDVVMTQGDTFREDFIVRDTDGSLLGARRLHVRVAGPSDGCRDRCGDDGPVGGHEHVYGHPDVRDCRVRRPRTGCLRS
jgi:hypothetical protein